MNLHRALLSVMVFLIVPLCGTAALAGELNTVINGKSFHLGSKKDWNEANYGLGVEYQLHTQTSWKPMLMANAFLDSEENMSYMAGGGLHRTIFDSDRLDGFYVDIGLNAFLMTREDVHDGRPFPGVLPSMTIGNRIAGVNLAYLPARAVERVSSSLTVDDDLDGILFLQLKLNVGALMKRD